MSDFAFSPEDEIEIKKILARYPAGCEQSAVMPVLTLAQKRAGGHLTAQAMEMVARRLDMALMRVYEIAHFYSMYYHEPQGRVQIHVCTSISCWLRGADELLMLSRKLAKGKNVSVHEAQCLGACVHAPVVMKGERYHENVTREHIKKFIKEGDNAQS